MLANSLEASTYGNIGTDKGDVEIGSNVLSLSEDKNYDGTDSDSDLDDEANSHNAAGFIQTCNNQAFAHVLSGKPSGSETLKVSGASEVSDATEAMERRYDSSAFRGLLINSGCSFISTGGIGQYIAYCREHGLKTEVDTTKKTAIVFTNKRHTSPGTATIRFPFQNGWLECELHLLPFTYHFCCL